jgi:lysyl-tRNA synthetase class 2
MAPVLGAVFDAHVEHTLIEPTFVHRVPDRDLAAVAQERRGPAIVDRFELYVAGRELATRSPS